MAVKAKGTLMARQILPRNAYGGRDAIDDGGRHVANRKRQISST